MMTAINKANLPPRQKYDVVIGLEVHAELNTKSKIFCSCSTSPQIDKNGNPLPNSSVCPVCMALPGALPVLNKMAVEKTITAGLCFGCQINKVTVYDRKNYFYPDLPKAYQISQMFHPICLEGSVSLSNGRVIRLNRIHSEEDAGKLLHDDINDQTLIDFNRCGVPLIEIVTEPDIKSAAEAAEFLREVRSRLTFAGISDAQMELGQMRCDVNVSLKPIGQIKLGNRVELKNLNSFKMVERSIQYEIKRQTALLDDGKKITVETRKWNDAKQITTSMRNKEAANDYRYFPDPDQYPVHLPASYIQKLKKALPKLSGDYKKDFINLGLTPYDTEILTREKKITELFLETCKMNKDYKKIANIIINSKDPLTKNQIIEKLNFKPTNTDRARLTDIIQKIFAAGYENNKPIDKLINYFMGKVMQATKGEADPELTKEIIKSFLTEK
ncbi:MAG: Asp-tRNA(Asn)/Glu-tRNA(Gln) amidotransferase subunit GatB [Christensenellaceae bacterium]|jgi:aspartyl-tRNA(Asn)/glutamyl-tRNA(Gln) amidotransferase subunit B|nr:Asp-tRNA(Asn)/Glu-tRNA(Gln) amidotransferase subunit GatB [Christensenellaceae bacterium]